LSSSPFYFSHYPIITPLHIKKFINSSSHFILSQVTLSRWMNSFQKEEEIDQIDKKKREEEGDFMFSSLQKSISRF